jgi:hypothetical protein
MDSRTVHASTPIRIANASDLFSIAQEVLLKELSEAHIHCDASEHTASINRTNAIIPTIHTDRIRKDFSTTALMYSSVTPGTPCSQCDDLYG